MLRLAFVVTLALSGPPSTGQVVVTPPPHVAAYPGVRFEIPVAIEVAPGLHVQANPASRPELIPLSVRITDDAGLTVQPPLYPPGHRHQIDTSLDPISVYEGSFQIGIPVEVSDAAAPGERMVTGQVRFQSCDDKRCNPPASTPFAVAIRIASRPVPAGDRGLQPARKSQRSRTKPSR